MKCLPRRGRRARDCALILVGVAVFAACGGDDAPSGPSAGSATIGGTVTRQKTGLGVPGMVAVLVRDGHVTATAHTDEAGHFDFGIIEQGSYTVRLTGFDIAGLDARFDVVEPQSRPAVVPDGDGDLVFTIVSVVAPRVSGSVTCTGAPAVGASVRVIGGATDTTITADATGRYTLLGLEPGSYAVIVVEAACDVAPAFRALDLLPGQAGSADFEG